MDSDGNGTDMTHTLCVTHNKVIFGVLFVIEVEELTFSYCCDDFRVSKVKREVS